MSGSSRWSDLDRPPLHLGSLQRALTPPNGPWTSLELVERTGSTNADLANRARTSKIVDLPHGTVSVADHQSAGKGRLGRHWTAPPRSSLAVSVLLRPDVPPSRWSWLPLLAGVALVDALTQVCGLQARLKWPNDVLLPVADTHRKVSGVLAEVVTGPPGAAVVLGIGLNVSLSASELPSVAATSLLLAGSATLDRDMVLRAALRALADRYAAWVDVRGDARACGLSAAYRESCLTIGRRVRVELPAAPDVLALADGVDDEGRLLLRRDDGQTIALAAGDVVHLRGAAS